MTSAKQYLIDEGIDQYFDLELNSDFNEGVFDAVSGQLQTPFPPVLEDLALLHQSIRQRKSFTVLEFGLGLSTIVIADALAKNKRDFFIIKKANRNKKSFYVSNGIRRLRQVMDRTHQSPVSKTLTTFG